MTNEAAERLLRFLEPEDRIHAKTLLDAALAAERKATVERIRAAALAKRKAWGAEGLPASLESILDAEAADPGLRWENWRDPFPPAALDVERLARALNRSVVPNPWPHDRTRQAAAIAAAYEGEK